MTLFTTLLFVLLTPGILVTLPPGGSKMTVALFHGVVFALVYHLTHKAVWNFTVAKMQMEQFKGGHGGARRGGARRH